jgi:serine/threonine protein kinase
MLPKVGSTIGGKYTLEAVIGRGGMGAVYRAKNLLTGRRVALKWILPTLNGADEMRARLLREARAMGRIEHPNVCAVYDVGEDGEAIYLVMELLQGRTLRSMMDERRLEVAEAAQILLSAMQGVSAAHRAGVVHRDLKPDNLFVCEADDGGRSLTKVLDFGVSKILDLSESDGLTKSGMAVGTPHYMSPEQIIGSKDVDARSDVYALGTILYQALAGRLPFDGENYSALVVQIATGAPEPLDKHASPEGALLAPIVHKAIARQPSDRHADVVELARALEPFAAGARFETPRPRPRSEPPPPEPESADAAAGAEVPLDTPDRALAETRDGRGGDRVATSPTLPARDYVVVTDGPHTSSPASRAELPRTAVPRAGLLVAGLVALAALAILGRLAMTSQPAALATSEARPAALARPETDPGPPAPQPSGAVPATEDVTHTVGAALTLVPSEDALAIVPGTSAPPAAAIDERAPEARLPLRAVLVVPPPRRARAVVMRA